MVSGGAGGAAARTRRFFTAQGLAGELGDLGQRIGLGRGRGQLARREGRLEPLLQQFVLEEGQRPVLLGLFVGLTGEIDDLDLDRPGLFQAFEGGIDAGADPLVLGFQAGAEVVEDHFQIGGDLHLEGGAHAAVGKAVEHADGGQPAFEGLLQDGGALLGQGQAEGRPVFRIHGRNRCPQDVLYRIESPRGRLHSRRAARALQVERDALHRAGFEDHRGQTRLGDARFGQERAADPVFLAFGQFQRGFEHGETAALDPRAGHGRLVFDEAEGRPVAFRAPGQLDRAGQIPELVGIGMVAKHGDAVDGQWFVETEHG